jgi:site-specific DNA-methyltransferase (adenine-specific)
MTKQYQIIYADPPWWYSSRISRGPGTRTRFGSGAEGHYPLMKDRELRDMAPKIKEISAKDAVCLMWATGPRLDFAMELMQLWGFKYSTIAYLWVKTTKAAESEFRSPKLIASWDDFTRLLPAKGPGGYTQSNVEPVLLGRRGKSLTVKNLPHSQVIFAPRAEHSRKPVEVRERIEELFGDRPRVELFCRYPAPGWDAHGHGVDGRDIREALA